MITSYMYLYCSCTQTQSFSTKSKKESRTKIPIASTNPNLIPTAYLKSGMPLGVLIPAPAIMIMFLHFSCFIKLAISTIFFTFTVLNALLLPDWGFLGVVLRDRALGGCGVGVNDKFLNCDTRPFSDWLFVIALRVGSCRFWLGCVTELG